MRALLIDPFAKSVTEVTHNGDYRDIYKHIQANAFDSVRVDTHHVCYLDDEGLFVPDQYYFQWGERTHLAGRGLVLGVDDQGESVRCTLPLQLVRDTVKFYDTQPVFDGIDTTEGYEPHPLMGRVMTIRNVPKFK